MKTAVFSQDGTEVRKIELPLELFDSPLSTDLLHQAILYYQGNKRQSTAHTKDRSEVSGGGRKPWRQKGTGRARHGSPRSPIWIGGGITFGPRSERVFRTKLNKKMRRKALFDALSVKARDGVLLLLEDEALNGAKTKMFQVMLQKLPCQDQRSLLVLPAVNNDVILAARNLTSVTTMRAQDLNALDVLEAKYVIMPVSAIAKIQQTFQGVAKVEAKEKESAA